MGRGLLQGLRTAGQGQALRQEDVAFVQIAEPDIRPIGTFGGEGAVLAVQIALIARNLRPKGGGHRLSAAELLCLRWNPVLVDRQLGERIRITQGRVLGALLLRDAHHQHTHSVVEAAHAQIRGGGEGDFRKLARAGGIAGGGGQNAARVLIGPEGVQIPVDAHAAARHQRQRGRGGDQGPNRRPAAHRCGRRRIHGGQGL